MFEYILVLLAAGQMGLLIFMVYRFQKIAKQNDILRDVKDLVLETPDKVRRDFSEQLDRFRLETQASSRELREEVGNTLRGLTQSQFQQIDAMISQWQSFSTGNDTRMKDLQSAVESKLDRIQANNSEKLEAMRATVEEKLQGTLDRRLGESFKLVSDRLEQVQRGLGEMQGLAIGVGDLKRVLTNVKTRGTWGEVQLSMILEQVLNPDQYEANSKLGRRSNDIVEFAVKLPGKDDDGGTVFLPIDSKFPQEQYQRILTAQDTVDPDGLASARKELEQAIKVAARDIRDKYIHPPHTTDFALMFVPTEGLYAEILRIPGMLEKLQSEYRVVISGPTTLAALLNSLQMGFKTLAIQKRSGEVWKILGAVKSEFGKFGELLDGVQKTLQTAANKLEDATKKTRTIESKLKGVEVISEPTQAEFVAVNNAMQI
ncbi:MAG: DNA recombination protein RmuC [Proteobacteria bacterium]|nr:DNA recombination protein RmuC [Pseudomonadota bacterium]